MVRARITSKARQFRFAKQIQDGRQISISEVADSIGVDRKALARLEDDETTRFEGPVIAKVCIYYGISVGDLLEVQLEEEHKEAPKG